MLEQSGITPDVRKARGYRSVTRKSELQALGFARSQLRVPALLIPIYGPTGAVVLYQARPDEPRIRDGKSVKYETIAGANIAVDVPPGTREGIRDPNKPLVITEGVKKADAAVSHGLCCVGLLGVWNWRGKNESGGMTALPIWDEIALKGRRVLIAFDSDVATKAPVRQAMARLKAFLESRGARVEIIYLPCGPGGEKVGLDDYLAAGHTIQDLFALAQDDLRGVEADASLSDSSTPTSSPYLETPQGLVLTRATPHGVVETPLANFTARILSASREDDGAEVQTTFEIEARLNGRTIRCRVPVREFPSLNWVLKDLGPGAILHAGNSVRDHVRAAIQQFSDDPPERVVFTHTGWIKMPDGRWGYLHGGGIIGVEDAGIEVRLSGDLSAFQLPSHPDQAILVAGVHALLRLLQLGPYRITFSLVAAVFRAVLGGTDFNVFLVGASGTFKSEVAALLQQFFGAAWSSRRLPASWSSTDNALEIQAFLLKDAACVIDDFAPHGSSADVQRMHAKADRVMRAQGNHSGRGRLRADGTPRPQRPPQGLVIGTGEDLPIGQSLRARTWVLDVGPSDISPQRLSICQKDAREGLYAAVLSGFLRRIAPVFEGVRADVPRQVEEYRQCDQGQHRRSSDIYAQLVLGFGFFLDFALHVGVINEAAKAELWTRCLEALTESGSRQAAGQSANEPTRRYRELLQGAIASGRAYIASIDNGMPEYAQRWGWRESERSGGYPCWQPMGDRIGWLDGDDLYLQPDAAFNVAKRMGETSGDTLVVTSKTAHKRLKERGLLLSVDSSRGVLTVRRSIGGSRLDVLHLHRSFLSGSDGADVDADVDQETAGVTPMSGRNGQVGQVLVEQQGLDAGADTPPVTVPSLFDRGQP